MLRNISLIALFVFASFLFMGAQSRSLAAIAKSSSWASTTKTPTLICNVDAAPDPVNGGYTGTFGVSGTNFTTSGSVAGIYNTKDAAGNLYSTVVATGAYYPTTGKMVIATFVLSMRKMTDGSQWEGFAAYDIRSGAPLFTTGATRDGSPWTLPVIRGSVTIGM